MVFEQLYIHKEMSDQKTIVLVLKDGNGFSFKDVELIVRHIHKKWKSDVKPRILCLWSRATVEYDLGRVYLIPLKNDQPGTWARIELYSPDMEKYRPFLYVDLDTAIIQSLENIFDLVKNPWNFITLEDFYQKEQLATGLVWFPPENKGIQRVWEAFKKTGVTGKRMDYFLRKYIVPDIFWQQLTSTIIDFKPKSNELLERIPIKANLICFHGKPRIFDAPVDWVKNYIAI
jgi:hypothetical protein